MNRHYNILKETSNLSGHFTSTVATQDIGAVRNQLSCILLSEPSDHICFSCPEETEEALFILELTELHIREDLPFSYEILVNDSPVYTRTMEPVSGSLCPCFVKLRFRAGDRITIRNNSHTPVRFTDIFLHSDLNAILAEYNEPMEIGLCFPQFTRTDRKTDLALMCQIKKDFETLKHFTVGIGVEVVFMCRNNAQTAQQIRYFLELAEEAGVNLIFNFNSWWGGTPRGRDGKGGYFTDIEYHQVIYDPLNGKKSLSIPNLWDNTPWYTMNHDHMNMVRKVRLNAAMEILKRQAILFKAEKGHVPAFRVFIDNEPTYWSEFAYTPSPECGGDFNEYCVAAAGKDGVDLTPRGPLTKEQKAWLLKNLCTYMTDLSEAYHRNADKEYALVTSEEVLYGNHDLSENIFTHTMAYSMYPYADGRHLLYEEHVNPWARLGVECAGFQDERILSYMNGTGRYGQVNSERCCYTDPHFHQQFYAHGAVCDNIFNYYYDIDVAHLHQLDNLEDTLAPDPVYGVPVMRYRSYDEELLDGKITAMENMEIAPLRERKVLRPANLGKGFITFSIGTAADYPNGGWIELTGLFRPFNGSLRASVGTDPEHPAVVVELPERNADYQVLPFKISLGKLLDSDRGILPHQTLYLRLDFEALFYGDWDQMNAIWEIRSIAAFRNSIANSDRLGTGGISTAKHAAVNEASAPEALPLTLNEYRALSLMTAYRTDYKRLLKDYQLSGKIPNDAIDQETVLCGSKNYKTLYEALKHKISIWLTDRFIIQGKGFLEKFRLHVDSGTSRILLKLTGTGTMLTADLTGTPGAELTLSMHRHLLQAERIAPNRFALTFTEAPDHSSGKPIHLTLEATPTESGTFHGTFLGYDTETGKIEVSTHKSAAWEYQPTLQFACEKSVPVTLTPSAITGNLLSHVNVNPYTPSAILNARIDVNPSIASLHPGDAVTLTLLDETVTSITALRGMARGKVVNVVPVSLSAPIHNAFLTIETAPDTRVTFELGMNTHLNYDRAHAANPLLAGELDLELRKNNIILVSFEPEKAEGRYYRALEITTV